MEIKDFGKLIRAITANVNYYIGSKIEKYGIKQGQFEYFILIYSTPGINQLRLAKLKNVGKASVTKALKILEDDGFIVREIDKNDRRNTLCYITKKGEDIVNELLNVRNGAQDRLFANFKQEEMELFYSFLYRLNQNSEQFIDE